MSTFERDISLLGDTDRLKRKNALKRLLDAVSAPEAGAWEPVKLKTLTSESLRRFEDVAEGCREIAISIVAAAVPLQRAEVMDYVLPSVAARIGTQPIREDSEELRLRLLDLAVLCLNTFPHDLGNFIDFYPVILTNCIADAFPDLKRTACVACVRLCEVEPKRVKSAALALGKAIKHHALNHKHAVVRCEAIAAFGVLLDHGAAEMLGDMRDEQDNQTTVYCLYQLANDRADSVRHATIKVLSQILLDINERGDQPRRVLPFVMSLLTDPIEEIRQEARRLLHQLGNLYAVDHADNRVDLDKRRITIKDIEWYADDAFPDMTMTTKSTVSFPDLNDRPSLGARHAVAEHVRNFLDDLLKDATGVNWTIPHSLSNKRTVALRTVAMIIVYCESNIVQYAQQILQTLYKVVRDEDKEVQTEGLVCAELMGKFMTADQYLPFLIAQSSDEEDGSTKKVDGKRVVTLLNADGSPSVGTNSLPTLFSTAGNITKASILTVMRLLLLGARQNLTVDQSKMVVKALTDPNLQNLEAPELMKNLIQVQLSTCLILMERGFVVADVAKEAPRTLDSMLVYSILTATAAEDASVVRAADAAIEEISKRLLGHPKAIYELHFGRWISRHFKNMPPEALTRLIENCPNLTAHAQFLVDLFRARLEKIQYNLRIQNELHFYKVLQSVMASHRLELTSDQAETLLRLVVLPQLQFTPGPTPALFRKVAFAVLEHVLDPFHRRAIANALKEDDGALSDKIATLWLNGTDADDPEIRWSCVNCFEAICSLPLRQGAASDAIDHILLRLNDTVDDLRLNVARRLRAVLYSSGDVCPTIVGAVFAKIETMVKTLLVHLDDHMEGVGIRDELCAILKRLKGINSDLVQGMVQQVRSKHHTTKYCDAVLEFEPSR